MTQRFVLKNRSKDADGHKETSNMIRDPRQKITKRKCVARKKTPTKTVPRKIKTKDATAMTSRAERKFLRSAAFK
jgi:hypothetical protein